MQPSGIIFDIKEFAVFDGPGIRQTVFLKGCPLRCQWCHNPEGLSPDRQLMFSKNGCTGCGKCAKACPNTGRPCNACGACAACCPLGLRRIVGTPMTAKELVDTLRKNSDYYAKQGGGVTFSGGEPLMQGDFLLAVLEQIPDLHTAIQTSGFCSRQLFAQVASRLSLVMMDIKLVDSSAHRHYTGVDNAPILDNLQQLCKGKTPFVIRIPLIPGVNDTAENLHATARLLLDAPALQGVELLPYHKTAGAKYGMVGLDYRPEFDVDAPVANPLDIFEQYNIRSTVA